MSGCRWPTSTALRRPATPVRRVLTHAARRRAGRARRGCRSTRSATPAGGRSSCGNAGFDAVAADGRQDCRRRRGRVVAAGRRRAAASSTVSQAINPLPLSLSAFRPTTGYDDVKMVAMARLAAPHVPHVQVDWVRYGPKLAQVALTFGADDVDGVSASDDAPGGPAARAARRDSPQHPGGGLRAGRARRARRDAYGMSVAADRRGRVPECPAADLGPRSATRALDVRYDLPAVCAACCTRGEVDLGLIPSIEYLQRRTTGSCPASASGRAGRSRRWRSSRGCRSSRFGTIALDTSSRTSVALTRVLCQHRFRIAPRFVPHGPGPGGDDACDTTRRC